MHSITSVLICTYAYVFLEWLFFVTKPSFLTIRSWPERIVALLVGVWPFLILALAMHLAFCLFAWVVGGFGKRPMIGRYMLKFIPALVIAAVSLMLVDNFTYTIFKWGIVKTGIYTAPLYWLLFVGVIIWVLRSTSAQAKTTAIVVGALLLLSIMALVWSAMGGELARGTSYSAVRSDATLPNIIMFASDGVNANHLSAYGYERKTTPNLDAKLDRALIAENTFTNSGMTTGSLTSMMTGRYPATTKVFYPPQTLQGQDAYEHLPRILRKLGYKSLQETIGYYADAKDLNWLDSFNYANGRELQWSRIDRLPIRLQAAAQLAESSRVRFQERAEQLLFVKRMTDAYAGVVSERGFSGNVISDDERMANVFNFIEHSRQPFFIHVHLMGTHCCKWHPKNRHFMVDRGASKNMQEDALFDDAILQSDQYFGDLMRLLDRKNLLDNTLVIYSSDHAKGWDFRSQVPLIFFFPHGEYKGNITTPTQLLDVAPTVLDYLKVKKPNWMEGRSIIGNQLPEYRPTFVGYLAQYVDTAALHAEIGPPYYDLAKAGLVVCNQWYILSLNDKNIVSGTIPTYRGDCARDRLPDLNEAKVMISKHLHERGINF
jgi:hypothetical protein